MREQIKKQIKKLREDFFYESPEELRESISRMELPMRGLVLVTKEFLHRYEAQKKEKNLLDFNDLEHMALRILVEKIEDDIIYPTEAAKTISHRFDEIMIDEYQDSNLIQESVLTSVSGIWRDKPNVFMVGDVKQSIYRFRMACPDLFMKKYETYGSEGKQLKIDLTKNFRSRRCVLDAINVLFAGLMRKEATEVDYDAAASLYFGASYPEEKDAHHTELLFVSAKEPEEKERDVTDTGQDVMAAVSKEENADTGETEGDNKTSVTLEEDELSQEEKSLVQAEAYAVAKRIRELRCSELTVGSEERSVDYGDIVVLLRTMSGWSEVFAEVFAEQEIPAYADTGSGYFKTFEVRKTLDFLRILDNPKQDIPFAAVLHSPIGGFNAEELAELRVAYGSVSSKEKTNRCLYEAAREAARVYLQDAVIPTADKKGTCKKAAHFFELYDRLLEEAEYISIHELVEHFYEYSGFYDVVTVMPGGERRRGNLDMLVARAKQYETTSFSGLYDFIRYIDRLIKYEVDFGEANNGEVGQMVRIMSIHKSKGLEFPVVFLCGMEKKLNRKDMQNRLIVHSKLGLGPEFVDPVLRVKSPTLFKKMIARQMNGEMIAEELRILYVAMTRAREKLIMVGAMKEPEKRYATWQEQAETVGENGLLASYILKANTYFDFICPLLFAENTGEYREVTDWKELLAYGMQVSLTKHMETERFPKAVFTGCFLLRECDAAEREEGKQELKQTKEELLAVLSQMKEMPPEESETAKQIRTLLERQQNYCYPYSTEANLPVKVTVSELKRLFMEQEETEEASLGVQTSLQPLVTEEISFDELAQHGDLVMQITSLGELVLPEDDSTYPEFLKPEKTLSGSDRGTIYHHVMELIPFEGRQSKECVKECLDRMLLEGKLYKEEREAVNDYKLWKFFGSSLGKRMCQAEEHGLLHREQPFVLGLAAKELYPESGSDETVLVQGIIDAFFEEEDGLVLMDYKTDYIHEDAKTELIKKYKGQLVYYRMALERLTGKVVKEVWFYAFARDEEVRVE